MEREEMTSLEFKYMLLSQRANYMELLAMTTDEPIRTKIQSFIDIIDETLDR